MSGAGMDRRALMKAGLLGAFAYSLGGAPVMLSPREARAQGADYTILTPDEAETLAALGEALAPGARDGGIAHFIDAQLAADPADALFMIRYLDVPPLWDGFYKAAAAALDRAARAAHGRGFADLGAEAAHALTGRIAADDAPDWSGPPPGLVYFALRADAVDVAYGTLDGFAALGVDYLPHIPPERPW